MLFLRVVFILMFAASTAMAFENFDGNFDVTLKADQSNELCVSTECFMPVKFRRRGENETPPNVWALDVSRPTDFCYVSSQDVTLWLPETNQKGLLSIKNTNTNTKTQFNWPSQENVIKWPQARIKISTGINYLVEIGGTLSKVTMHQIPAGLSTAEQINSMREKGCMEQADMLESEQKPI